MGGKATGPGMDGPIYHLLNKGFGHQFNGQGQSWGAFSDGMGLRFSSGWS